MRVYYAPMRISLFGGGSDLESYYSHHKGAVIGFPINKYIYLSSFEPCGFEKFKYRLTYAQVEHTQGLDEINHPLFREVFRSIEGISGFNFGVHSEIPARGGLASSSALAVCLALYLREKFGGEISAMNLAKDAIKFERQLCAEAGGIQDQLHCSHAGVNRFEFFKGEILHVPVAINAQNLEVLSDSLFLVSTQTQRFASSVATCQDKRTKSRENDKALDEMVEMVYGAQRLMEAPCILSNLSELGQLLLESWELKKTLSSDISNAIVDQVISEGRKAGAVGAKLCGAGVGGYVLFVVPPEPDIRRRFFKKMSEFKPFNVRICGTGYGASNVHS